MDQNEKIKIGERPRFARIGKWITELQRLDNSSDGIKSTRKDGSVDVFSLWSGNEEDLVPSVISRIDAFMSGKRGLAFIPKGDDVDIRGSVLASVHNDTANTWYTELDDMESGSVDKDFKDRKVTVVMDKKGYIEEVFINVDLLNDQKVFDSRDGLRIEPLRVVLAACQVNEDRCRSGKDHGIGMENLVPKVSIYDSLNLFPDVEIGVPLLDKNEVIKASF